MSSPGTTPTAQPGSCPIQTGNAACDTCLTTSCCSQMAACDADPSCVAADTCLSNCADTAASEQAFEQCATQCEQQNAAGMQKLDLIYQCADTSCQTQCGGP